MKTTLLEKLACPFDKADLDLKIISQEKQEIKEGVLSCPVCKRYYPIVYGIPIMSPDEYREKQLELPLLAKWGIPSGGGEHEFLLEEHTEK